MWINVYLLYLIFLQIHPEAPKKPCPPNAMFYEENWAKFQEKHPNMKKSDLLKLINQMFKELSKDEKVWSV